MSEVLSGGAQGLELDVLAVFSHPGREQGVRCRYNFRGGGKAEV